MKPVRFLFNWGEIIWDDPNEQTTRNVFNKVFRLSTSDLFIRRQYGGLSSVL